MKCLKCAHAPVCMFFGNPIGCIHYLSEEGDKEEKGKERDKWHTEEK